MALTQDSASKIGAANPESTVATLQRLYDRLDGLWTTYLQYLDTYKTSQDILQQHMSTGFLSLARANFNARNGVRRYGKDFYHERAVATRIIHVDVGDDGRPRLDTARKGQIQTPVSHEADVASDTRAGGDNGKVPEQQPSPPTTPESSVKRIERPSREDEKATEPSDGATKTTESSAMSKEPLESDPLRWFGILVPRELRSAQLSFSSAMDNAVTNCANAARGMREIEVQIRRLRKEVRRAEREVKS